MRSSFLFSPSPILLKKGWTYNPGASNRGGKNTIWRPKMTENRLRPFTFLDFEHPRRRPDSWNEYEIRRLGIVAWPKAVGFFNKGDNFELTPEMCWRLFLRNKNEEHWTPEDNEQVIINLIPTVELNPQENIPKIEQVFAQHVERFGVDHIIYNAVLQAVAFSRDLPRCQEIFIEMQQQGLVPNAQTYVNMMLACRLEGKENSKDKASKYFNEAVQTGALESVVRLDTEFQMWWDQLTRMGSFTEKEKEHEQQSSSSSFLATAAKEEGAKPLPEDPFALWGWDSRAERKFDTKFGHVRRAVINQNRGGRSLGSVFNSYNREPWHRYKGMLKWDFNGPPKKVPDSPRSPFEDAPPSSPTAFGKQAKAKN